MSPLVDLLSHLDSSLDSYLSAVVGILVLADIPTLARLTASAGTTSPEDCLIICPGLHKQQDAPKLSNGEYPACAAMTTGYVFRVENEATVHYMQRMGRTGQLTTLSVSDVHHKSLPSSRVAYLLIESSCALTGAAIGIFVALQDWYALAYILLLVYARIVNIIIIRRRAQLGWKGQREPGVKSDLLVLLSQDRWIRLRGLTDHVKLLTSGAWLRPSTSSENIATTLATLLVYLGIGFAVNACSVAKLLLVVLMVSTALSMELVNEWNRQLSMHGLVISVVSRTKYERRLQMAEQLVNETGRDDWCAKMGIILSTSNKGSGHGHGKEVIM